MRLNNTHTHNRYNYENRYGSLHPKRCSYEGNKERNVILWPLWTADGILAIYIYPQIHPDITGMVD